MIGIDQLRKHLSRRQLHRAATGNVLALNDTPVQVHLAKVVIVDTCAIFKLVAFFKRVLSLGRLLLCIETLVSGSNMFDSTQKHATYRRDLLLMRRFVQRSTGVWFAQTSDPDHRDENSSTFLLCCDEEWWVGSVGSEQAHLIAFWNGKREKRDRVARSTTLTK